jgi:hypothetical protein
MGHRKIETTKNIDGKLFAQDKSLILKAPGWPAGSGAAGPPDMPVRSKGRFGRRGQKVRHGI